MLKTSSVIIHVIIDTVILIKAGMPKKYIDHAAAGNKLTKTPHIILGTESLWFI